MFPLNEGGGQHRIHDTGHLQLKSIEENESAEYLMCMCKRRLRQLEESTDEFMVMV